MNQDRRLVGEWGTGYDDEIMGLEIQVKILLPCISLNFGIIMDIFRRAIMDYLEYIKWIYL